MGKKLLAGKYIIFFKELNVEVVTLCNSFVGSGSSEQVAWSSEKQKRIYTMYILKFIH